MVYFARILIIFGLTLLLAGGVILSRSATSPG
jgi:hypothetical protein